MTQLLKREELWRMQRESLRVFPQGLLSGLLFRWHRDRKMKGRGSSSSCLTPETDIFPHRFTADNILTNKKRTPEESVFCCTQNSESGVSHQIFVKSRFSGVCVTAHPKTCDTERNQAQYIQRKKTDVKPEQTREMSADQLRAAPDQFAGTVVGKIEKQVCAYRVTDTDCTGELCPDTNDVNTT